MDKDVKSDIFFVLLSIIFLYRLNGLTNFKYVGQESSGIQIGALNFVLSVTFLSQMNTDLKFILQDSEPLVHT